MSVGNTNQGAGFTLVEVIAVIAIISILSAMTFTNLASFATNTGPDAAARTVLGAFEEAHARTLAAYGDTQYGVHLATTTVTIFPGATYSASNPANDVRGLPARTEASTIALTASTTDVLFTRLTGAASATGTVIVSSIVDPSRTRTLTVYSTGLVEVEE